MPIERPGQRQPKEVTFPEPVKLPDDSAAKCSAMTGEGYYSHRCDKAATWNFVGGEFGQSPGRDLFRCNRHAAAVRRSRQTRVRWAEEWAASDTGRDLGKARNAAREGINQMLREWLELPQSADEIDIHNALEAELGK